ncbi:MULTISPECIES: NAD(P)/FAD-dependent oxidoreductase [unclassified Shewanella]|uniref:NAD(P)/FAD-dependent oxidoreductase n=1 Tax=unclassified Shewanella TaxID=196818 RepID=UPI000C85A1DC|nr:MULTISPECIES: NAD(P)/FAD-dependent oxidoreductase [unclassified Shewanella]MDO6618641.1 NAD(P)/FAD-dependent oxidoreductase [Shewanella sp. 6_MG-2023]MDO6641144.1 NAD(P)/FAD-dependent oxidoreductase [Shewanella sp. 5_MG-2023]MDO6678556.1 NAD(P)/FAD-dependent oxidoreductase [Shewanella sp. 4_MG-2023]PMH85996.1 NADH dehydrogenase [Shewanella sp. 10N.286.48.B5]PMI01226.1 NADH dehydrogenase [Shewanella sp. 10N.286.48.A6]
MQAVPNIVIVGGGAGGMEIATKLGHKVGRKAKAKVTLVDCAESHVWKPLLHEVATGALDIGIDAISYRGHASAHGYHFQQGAMIDINRDDKHIILAPINDENGDELLPARHIPYDYLVIAIGSVANDFNIPGVKEHSLFLDNTEQAMQIRKLLLNKFMRYASHHQLDDKIKIAVVGAGATGVEMSAEMHHAVEQLSGFGYKIDTSLLEVSLIEADERILPKVGKVEISDSVTRELKQLGVKVMTNTRITQVTPEGLSTTDNTLIPADMVIWSTGVKAPNFLNNIGGLESNHINQVMVKQNMQTTLDPSIFSIGDCAACPQADGSWVPPRGQSARQMALMTADNIMLMLAGKDPKNEYVYKDLGSLVNLSKFHTVGNLMSFMGGGVLVEGKIARFVYTSLYRRHLIELHGVVKGTLMMLAKGISRIIHPHLKLH